MVTHQFEAMRWMILSNTLLTLSTHTYTNASALPSHTLQCSYTVKFSVFGHLPLLTAATAWNSNNSSFRHLPPNRISTWEISIYPVWSIFYKQEICLKISNMFYTENVSKILGWCSDFKRMKTKFVFGDCASGFTR